MSEVFRFMTLVSRLCSKCMAARTINALITATFWEIG
jgi:hypothetical protein